MQETLEIRCMNILNAQPIGQHFTSHTPSHTIQLLKTKFTLSKSDQRTMREWAQQHGKAVRQLTIRQTNTKHAAGTLTLNKYRKELQLYL